MGSGSLARCEEAEPSHPLLYSGEGRGEGRPCERATLAADFTRRAAALLALFALVAACSGASPPAVRTGPPPAPATLWQALTARQQAVRTMNARVRATSWIGGDRVRATVLMLVDRPGRLRFEAEVSLQGTVSILATHDGDFQMLDVRSGKLQQGPACPANVASLIRMPLAPGEVAAILLGDVQVAPAGAGSAQVEWDAGRGADALVVRDGNTETRVFFRPDKPDEIVGAAFAGPEGPRWRASYEELAPVAGGPRLPGSIRFAEHAESYDQGVEIRFKDRTLNPDLPADSFTIAPPAGTQIIDVGCGPAPGG
jgi:outer membrane lipoprotein-sorting protein